MSISSPARRASPLSRSVLLLFAVGALVCMVLLLSLLLSRQMLPLADVHVYAERVEALRWLQQHVQPVSDVQAPCAAADALCRALQPLNQRLAISGVAVQMVPDELVPKGVIDSARELGRSSLDQQAIRQLLRDSSQPDFGVHSNPFRLPGCLYGADTVPANSATDTQRCRDGVPLSPAHFPPHSLPLWERLADWRQAWDGVAPNRYQGLSTGRALWLTLHSELQIKAQQTADCYVGQGCTGPWWVPRRHEQDMYEQARARSVGIVVLEVNSGAIRAMSSAYTPCFAARAQGKTVGAACPSLPNDKARPHRLGNPVGEGEMPGSSLKPQQALALLEAGNLTAAERAKLPDILRRSDTEAMIDLYLCQSQGFDLGCIQRRVAALERRLRVAAAQADCAAGPCRAELDLLAEIHQQAGSQLLTPQYRDQQLRQQDKAFRYPVFSLRMLQDGQKHSLLPSVAAISPEAARACYQNGYKHRWRGCQGAALVNLIAELYGQGNARASQLGLAIGWLQLAHAAAQRGQAPRPQLLAAYQGADGQRHTVKSQADHGISADHARWLLEALEKVPGSGSAASACRAASKAGGALRCQPSPQLRIAAKTGTPLFSVDHEFAKSGNMLDAWSAACQQAAQGPDSAKNRVILGKCTLRPLKWFSALVAPTGQGYQYLVIVQAERNWHRNGRIDDPGDITEEGNVAAEIGFALINALITPAPGGGLL